jgi:hypothetical protein
VAHHQLDPFDVPTLGEPFGGGEGVSASLVEQLTQAIQDLTGRLQTSAGMPGTSAGAGTPWWFAYKQNYPGAPTEPPPGSAAARDSGWWGRYTDPGAEDFTYVRSYFRRKAVPRPDVPMAPAMPTSPRRSGSRGSAAGQAVRSAAAVAGASRRGGAPSRTHLPTRRAAATRGEGDGASRGGASISGRPATPYRRRRSQR